MHDKSPSGTSSSTSAQRFGTAKGAGPLFTPDLPLAFWYEVGLDMLKQLWSSEEIGMCAIRIDEIVELARQSGQDPDYVSQLRQGLNHLASSKGWLVAVENDDGRYEPGHNMQTCIL